MKQHEINTSFVQMRLNFASSSCPVTHRQTQCLSYMSRKMCFQESSLCTIYKQSCAVFPSVPPDNNRPQFSAVTRSVPLSGCVSLDLPLTSH